MTLKFLTKNKLETYYGKPITKISPTDTPLQKYIVGHTTITCNNCNTTLHTTCTGTPHQTNPLDGYIDTAYCTNCNIKYTRKRTPVTDNPNYPYDYYRTDEREEYICTYCHQRHILTKPTDTFTQKQPTINSHEGININCPCGHTIHTQKTITLPTTINCPNCPRTFPLKTNTREK